MTKLVSVVVTAYNHEAYIEDAIRSVLDQTYQGVEVIVVDDGSTDDTPHRIRGFGAAVTCIRQRNRGVAAARNAGVARARGDLIALLDGDDLWEPGKLAAQVSAAEHHPEAGLIVVDGVEFGPGGVLEPRLLGQWARDTLARAGERVVSVSCHEALVDRSFIATTSQVMIPAAVLRTVGSSDVRFRTCSDYDLYLRIAAAFPVALVGEPLVRWRYLASSASGPRERRPLRWREEEIAVLRMHLTRVPPETRPLIRAAIRTRLYKVARDIYYQGLATDRRQAARHLVRLQASSPLQPMAIPFLLGLWAPRAVGAAFGPLVRRLVGAKSRG